MHKMKLAIPTKGDKGLEDSVSDVFGLEEHVVFIYKFYLILC